MVQKKRHQKRRVIRDEFLDLLDQIVVGGELHIMTDFQPIGEEALEMLRRAPALQETSQEPMASEELINKYPI